MSSIQSPIHSDSLADVLERVLDKGVVIAGDVVISLVGIELLSIKVRLLITTVDKALEMGINWWEVDPMLSAEAHRAQKQLAEQQKLSQTAEPVMTKSATPLIEQQLTGQQRVADADKVMEENRALRGRLAILEKRLEALEA